MQCEKAEMAISDNDFVPCGMLGAQPQSYLTKFNAVYAQPKVEPFKNRIFHHPPPSYIARFRRRGIAGSSPLPENPTAALCSRTAPIPLRRAQIARCNSVPDTSPPRSYACCPARM